MNPFVRLNTKTVNSGARIMQKKSIDCSLFKICIVLLMAFIYLSLMVDQVCAEEEILSNSIAVRNRSARFEKTEDKMVCSVVENNNGVTGKENTAVQKRIPDQVFSVYRFVNKMVVPIMVAVTSAFVVQDYTTKDVSTFMYQEFALPMFCKDSQRQMIGIPEENSCVPDYFNNELNYKVFNLPINEINIRQLEDYSSGWVAYVENYYANQAGYDSTWVFDYTYTDEQKSHTILTDEEIAAFYKIVLYNAKQSKKFIKEMLD